MQSTARFLDWVTWRLESRYRVGLAYSILRVYLALLPRDEQVWLVLHALLRRSRSPKLVIDLRRGVDATASPLLYQYLGDALARTGEGEEARTVLDKALELWPESPAVYMGFARLHVHAREFAAAKSMVDQALERLDPRDDYGLFVDCASALLDIPGSQSKGQEILEQAVKIQPDDWIPHLYLAALLQEENPEASTRHLERFQRITGLNADETRDELKDATLRLAHPSSPT